jgi:hypothetical protein
MGRPGLEFHYKRMRNLYLMDVQEQPHSGIERVLSTGSSGGEHLVQADGSLYDSRGSFVAEAKGRLLAACPDSDSPFKAYWIVNDNNVLHTHDSSREQPLETKKIMGASFSRDGRYLLTLSSELVLEVFDLWLDFGQLFQVNLRVPDLGAINEQVSVGWGRKETQFHGSGAKVKAQVREDISRGLCEGDSADKVIISWRPDSAYAAISLVVPGDHGPLRRLLIVDIQNQYPSGVSEPLSLVEPTLAWFLDEPSSIFLAVAQRSLHTTKVLIVERNGLKHREFDLKRPVGVRTLRWSPQCDEGARTGHRDRLLAVLFEDNVVQVWTVSNCHWACKFELLPVDNDHGNILDVTLDGKLGLRIFRSNGVKEYRFIYDVGTMLYDSPRHSLVGVVDGRCLKVTPMSASPIPPPMCLFSVDLAAVPLSFVFHESPKHVDLLVYFSDHMATFLLDLEDHSHIEQVSVAVSTLEAVLQLNRALRTINLPNERVILDADSSALKDNDGHVLMEGCSSVHYIADSKLLLAIGGTQLHFLDCSSTDSMRQDLGKRDDLHMRTVEVGTYVVTHAPNQCSVVLQMSRGNLEIIYPRSLVLRRLGALLKERAYRPAFLLARRHRLDWNLFVTPVLNVAYFVRDVSDPAYLSVFIASISEANQRLFVPQIVPLLKIDLRRNYEPLMTAYGALKDIASLLSVILDIHAEHPDVVESAIKYALFLTNGEELFRAALARFHLPLALSIAKRTLTMEPRDYDPLIRSLAQVLDPAERKLAICEYLQDHSLALQVISEVSETADRMHRLELFLRQHPDQHKLALLKFADNVCLGAMILRSYASVVSEPRDRLICLYLCGSPEDDDLTLILQERPALQPEFIANGRQLHVVDEFTAILTARFDQALEYAVESHQWVRAVQYSRLIGDPSLLAVKERLGEHLEQQIQVVSDLAADLADKFGRLVSLQERFISDPVGFLASFQTAANPKGDPDQLSDALSQLSFGTQRTSRTKATSIKSSVTSSKNKRLRDKPGSLQERDYLFGSTQDALNQVRSFTSNIQDLVRACELCGLSSKGHSLLQAWHCLKDGVEAIDKRWSTLMERQLTRARQSPSDDADLASMPLLYEDWHVRQQLAVPSMPRLASAFF